MSSIKPPQNLIRDKNRVSRSMERSLWPSRSHKWRIEFVFGMIRIGQLGDPIGFLSIHSIDLDRRRGEIVVDCLGFVLLCWEHSSVVRYVFWDPIRPEEGQWHCPENHRSLWEKQCRSSEWFTVWSEKTRRRAQDSTRRNGILFNYCWTASPFLVTCKQIVAISGSVGDIVKDLRRNRLWLLDTGVVEDILHRPSTWQSNGRFRDNANVHCTGRAGWREIAWVVELRSDQAEWHLCSDERKHRREIGGSPQHQQERWSLRHWVELSSWNECWSKRRTRRHRCLALICSLLTLARDSAVNSPAADSSPSFFPNLLGSGPPTRKIRSSIITDGESEKVRNKVCSTHAQWLCFIQCIHPPRDRRWQVEEDTTQCESSTILESCEEHYQRDMLRDKHNIKSDVQRRHRHLAVRTEKLPERNLSAEPSPVMTMKIDQRPPSLLPLTCVGLWFIFTGTVALPPAPLAAAVAVTAAACVTIWSALVTVTSFCERLRENSASERVNGNCFRVSCECKCRWKSFSC